MFFILQGRMNEMRFHIKKMYIFKVDADAGTQAVKRASFGSWALLSSWLQVILMVMMSASWSRCQVFGVRLLSHSPCGFHVRACLVVLLAGFRIVFPARLYRSFWISWLQNCMLAMPNLQPLSVVKLSGLKQK